MHLAQEHWPLAPDHLEIDAIQQAGYGSAFTQYTPAAPSSG